MSASTSTDLAERVVRLRAGLASTAEGHGTLSNLTATGNVADDQSVGADWGQGWAQGWAQYATPEEGVAG